MLMLCLGGVSGASAQVQQPAQPQITVNGVGKVMAVPDQAILQIGVQQNGKDAAEAKKGVDQAITQTLSALKKWGINATDIKTTQWLLNKNYDYEKKKNYYIALQTLEVKIKDLSKYNEITDGLTSLGINTIQGVQFSSSKIEELTREARQKAVLQARQKAIELTQPLNQKIGKAIAINEIQSGEMEARNFRAYAMKSMDAAGAPVDTLAQGEMDIQVQVNVTFVLE
jgi:uncharacterized protein YggE